MKQRQFLAMIAPYKTIEGTYHLDNQFMDMIVAYKIPELREKLAKGLESGCEHCAEDIWCGKDEKNQECSCCCHRYANLLRGSN